MHRRLILVVCIKSVSVLLVNKSDTIKQKGIPEPTPYLYSHMSSHSWNKPWNIFSQWRGKSIVYKLVEEIHVSAYPHRKGMYDLSLPLLFVSFSWISELPFRMLGKRISFHGSTSSNLIPSRSFVYFGYIWLSELDTLKEVFQEMYFFFFLRYRYSILCQLSPWLWAAMYRFLKILSPFTQMSSYVLHSSSFKWNSGFLFEPVWHSHDA